MVVQAAWLQLSGVRIWWSRLLGWSCLVSGCGGPGCLVRAVWCQDIVVQAAWLELPGVRLSWSRLLGVRVWWSRPVAPGSPTSGAAFKQDFRGQANDNSQCQQGLALTLGHRKGYILQLAARNLGPDWGPLLGPLFGPRSGPFIFNL